MSDGRIRIGSPDLLKEAINKFPTILNFDYIMKESGFN